MSNFSLNFENCARTHNYYITRLAKIPPKIFFFFLKKKCWAKVAQHAEQKSCGKTTVIPKKYVCSEVCFQWSCSLLTFAIDCILNHLYLCWRIKLYEGLHESQAWIQGVRKDKLYYIIWPNFVVWFPLFIEKLGNMCVLTIC